MLPSCQKKARIHPGMLLVVFAVNYAEKAYTASISQAGSGDATSSFEFRHGAVAPRLTDRGGPSATPSDKHHTIRQTAAQQQRSTSTSTQQQQRHSSSSSSSSSQ